MTAWLLTLLFNLILFKFMTLAKSQPDRLDKIDNKLPKLTTTQQHGHLTHLRKPQMTCPPPVSEEEMHQAVRTLLLGLGEDPDREGLKDTPKRVVKALRFLTSGYHQSLDELLNGAVFHEDANEMVLVRDIDLFSSCEHHILPIIGRAHVAYIPDGKVIGLSKIARICEMYGRRLQVQERLTAQIADALQGLLQPKGVAVVVEASHMCMVMRGVQKPGSWTSTSAVRGVFADDAKTRQEFMSLVRHNRGWR